MLDVVAAVMDGAVLKGKWKHLTVMAFFVGPLSSSAECLLFPSLPTSSVSSLVGCCGNVGAASYLYVLSRDNKL